MKLKDQEKWVASHQKQILDMAIKRCYENYEDNKHFANLLADRDEYDPLEEVKRKFNHNKNNRDETKYGSPYLTPEDLLYEDLMRTRNFDFSSMIHKTSNSKEVIGKINLKPYLNKIRTKDYETNIVLLIRNNKVLKEYYFTGNSQRIKINLDERKRIVKEASELKASIYEVHNHPMSIAAYPSCAFLGKKKLVRADIGARYDIGKLCQRYKVKYLDCGIVTEFDYYSSLQKEGKDFYKNIEPWKDEFYKKKEEREANETKNGI